MGKKKKMEVEKIIEEGAKQVGEMISTSISIAEKVWREAKIESLNRGISLASFIESAMRKELARTTKKKGEK